MMSVRLSAGFPILVAVFWTLQRVDGAEFIFGGEARRVCQAYKMICPAKKVCALQSLEWPRAMKFPVCVHDRHVIVKSRICKKPPSPGKCGAQFMRWYFNVHMGTCSWFTYGGCGGNQNNFRTVEECENRCMDIGPEEAEERRRIRERQRINNMILVDEDRASVNDITNDEDDDKAPTFITAPAKAAEIISLDNDVRASLDTNQNNNATAIAAWKAERRRRRKERRRRRRQRNKMRRKNRNNNNNNSNNNNNNNDDTNNETVYTPRTDVTLSPPRKPPRKLSPIELGPYYGTQSQGSNSPNYAELKGRETSISQQEETTPRKDRYLWLMDRRFRRRRRRRNRRKESRDEGQRPNDVAVAPVTSSGAKHDSYYDTIQLFDILLDKNNSDKIA